MKKETESILEKSLTMLKLNPDDTGYLINFIAAFGRAERAGFKNNPEFESCRSWIEENKFWIFKDLEETIDPEEWLYNAMELLNNHLSLNISEEGAVALFRRLFLELDDANLIFRTAEMFGVTFNEFLEDELDNCMIYLAKNPDMFLPCAEFVMEQYREIKPDIANSVMEKTISPYVLTIECFERMRAES